MARTIATNFTGGLQFPYATAATDIFKKEDVQTLAQAVDQHNHTTGKGLALAAASIPNGFITSAMLAPDSVDSSKIVNGAIAAADMASGAALGNLVAGTLVRSTLVAITAASSTTSAAFVVSGPDQVGWSPAAGVAATLAVWQGSMSNTTKGAIANLYLGWAGGATFQPVVFHAPEVGYGVPLTLWMYLNSPPTGAQVIQVYWLTNAGTLSMVANRSIVIFEFSR